METTVKSFLFLLALSATLSCAVASASSERDALCALYNSTSGHQWRQSTGWCFCDGSCAESEYCEWFGVECDGTNVNALYLGDNQLIGSIPAEIGSLSVLQVLIADNNQLSGSIPAEIGSLSSLQRIYLGGNQLSGSIPAEIGLLSALQVLIADNNQLSGSIPAEIGSLALLFALYLDNNKLQSMDPSVVLGSNVYCVMRYNPFLCSSVVPAVLKQCDGTCK